MFDQSLAEVDDQAQLEAGKAQVGEDLGLEDGVVVERFGVSVPLRLCDRFRVLGVGSASSPGRLKDERCEMAKIAK